MDRIGLETLKRMEKVNFYNKWLVGKVRQYLSGDILEIGSGIGNMTELLAKYGTVVATDIEKYYISKTKKRLRKKVLVGFGNAETGEFFFENKKFDVVISFNVLEHINDDQKAINNMTAKLKGGGRLIILTPAHKLLFGSLDKSLGHFKRYSKHEIVGKFKNANLNIIEVKYLNWFGAIGWFVNSKILRRKLLPSKQLGAFAVLAKPLLFLERFLRPPFGLSVLIVGVKK